MKKSNPGFTLTKGTPVEILWCNKVCRRGVVEHRGPNAITIRANRSGRLFIFELDSDISMWRIAFRDGQRIRIRKEGTGFVIRRDQSAKTPRRHS